MLATKSLEAGELGTFTVEVSIGGQARERWITDALVDTGASITSMLGSVLQELGVEPVSSEGFA